MAQKSDTQVIELMRQCFVSSKRYNRHTSNALKHVLQQIDSAFYLPEWEFVRLLKKAGYSIKPTASLHYKVKVWVIPNDKVNRSLWGRGDELKFLGNG